MSTARWTSNGSNCVNIPPRDVYVMDIASFDDAGRAERPFPLGMNERWSCEIHIVLISLWRPAPALTPAALVRHPQKLRPLPLLNLKSRPPYAELLSELGAFLFGLADKEAGDQACAKEPQ